MRRIARAAAGTAAALGLLLPVGAVALASPAFGPGSDDECRMFETKPGYECSFGHWERDITPPRAGEPCSFAEHAIDLTCSAGRWVDDSEDSSAMPRRGQSCTAVGMNRIGIGGMLTCRLGARGFTWE